MPKSHTKSTRFGPQPIRVVLYERGISAQGFAESIGITYSHASKANRGYIIPSQAYIDLSSKALGMAPSHLFTQEVLNASYYRGAAGGEGRG